MGLFDTAAKRRNTLADLGRGLSAFAGNSEPAPAEPEPAELPEWLPYVGGAVVVVLVVVLAVAVKR